MYVDLAFTNHAELTAAVVGEPCFNYGKGERLAAAVAALHTLQCRGAFVGFLVVAVPGTAFLLWADGIQCGATFLEPFSIRNQGCKALSAWGLPLPLLPSGSLSSSCVFPALATKMSWNVPPLGCSFSLCLSCAIWCFHLPGCACKAVCALAHLAYVA